MSLTINRFGGGSGVSESNAILMVHAPTGSTITASKGGITLAPKMWVSGSTVDEDVAMFILSSAQFDANTPWTITATDGTSTASDTVLITTNKEYEVKLAYNLWLYNKGNTYDSTTGGWQVYKYNANANLVLQADKIYISVNSSSGSTATISKVDVTDYNSMHVVFNSLNMPTQSNFYAGLNANTPQSTDAHQGSHLYPYTPITGSGSNVEIIVDISTVSGLYYAEVACSANVTTAITQIWLSPEAVQ